METFIGKNNQMKKCLVCGETDELRLIIIEFNRGLRWWMCMGCVENKNDEWTLAKDKFYSLYLAPKDG